MFCPGFHTTTACCKKLKPWWPAVLHKRFFVAMFSAIFAANLSRDYNSVRFHDDFIPVLKCCVTAGDEGMRYWHKTL